MKMKEAMIDLKSKGQKGFTLLEVLLVFVVVGVLITVLYAIFGPTLSNAKAEGQATQSSSDAAGIQKVYQGRYTGITTAIVISLPNILPAKKILGTTYQNTWGGSNIITPSTFTGVANAGFMIEHQGVPKSDCVFFATELSKRFKRVDVGAAAVANTVKAYGGEMDIPTLATKCGGITTGKTSIFAYYN